MTRQIHMVRHGEPEEGYTGRYLGRLDPGLSPRGVQQAGVIAGRVAELAPDRCLSSPLLRASATAGIIARACGLAVERDDRLLEIDFGELEGKTFKEARLIHPEIVDSWQALSGDFSFPGGEDFAAFNRRARSLADWAKTCEGERLLLVGHGGLLRGVLCNLLDIPANGPLRFRFAYAAIASVEVYPDGGVVLTGFNLGGAINP